MIDYNEIYQLLSHRMKAKKEYMVLKDKYANDKTLKNYHIMNISDVDKIYQRKIYTHENTIYYCDLLKANNNKPLIFDETKTYLIMLSLSSTKLPYLNLSYKKIKEIETEVQ